MNNLHVFKYLVLSFILIEIYLVIVEGFTEAKIERFGQAIVGKVVEVCNKQQIDINADENVKTCDSKYILF